MTGGRQSGRHNMRFLVPSLQTPAILSVSHHDSFWCIFSIHNHQPNYSQAFQVAGRTGPDAPLLLHKQPANYKGSSNKWALCGVSKTHRERKCSLSCHPPHPPPPPPPSHTPPPIPPSTKTISGRPCWRQCRVGEREDGERKEKEVETGWWATHAIPLAHLVCVTRCRMSCVM